MSKVFFSIVREHNSLLLIFAVVICLLASFTAFSYFQHAQRKPTQKWRMISIAAVTSGLGIWASQFTFILSYEASAPFTYALPIAFGSLVAAMVGSGLGWAMAARERSFGLLYPSGGSRLVAELRDRSLACS